jgi:hypothetical protein
VGCGGAHASQHLLLDAAGRKGARMICKRTAFHPEIRQEMIDRYFFYVVVTKGKVVHKMNGANCCGTIIHTKCVTKSFFGFHNFFLILCVAREKPQNDELAKYEVTDGP